MTINDQARISAEPLLLLLGAFAALTISGIHPHDRMTWLPRICLRKKELKW